MGGRGQEIGTEIRAREVVTMTGFELELQRSVAADEQRRADGAMQFDGDPHWDKAMKALADAAIEDAEKIKNAAAEAGTAG